LKCPARNGAVRVKPDLADLPKVRIESDPRVENFIGPPRECPDIRELEKEIGREVHLFCGLRPFCATKSA
jgi:hypothetical protein